MSASEIIEQIEALPEDEQKEVFAFVRSRGISSTTPRVRLAKNEEAREAGEAVVAQYSEVFQRLAE